MVGEPFISIINVRRSQIVFVWNGKLFKGVIYPGPTNIVESHCLFHVYIFRVRCAQSKLFLTLVLAIKTLWRNSWSPSNGVAQSGGNHAIPLKTKTQKNGNQNMSNHLVLKSKERSKVMHPQNFGLWFSSYNRKHVGSKKYAPGFLGQTGIRFKDDIDGSRIQTEWHMTYACRVNIDIVVVNACTPQGGPILGTGGEKLYYGHCFGQTPFTSGRNCQTHLALILTLKNFANTVHDGGRHKTHPMAQTPLRTRLGWKWKRESFVTPWTSFFASITSQTLLHETKQQQARN